MLCTKFDVPIFFLSLQSWLRTDDLFVATKTVRHNFFGFPKVWNVRSCQKTVEIFHIHFVYCVSMEKTNVNSGATTSLPIIQTLIKNLFHYSRKFKVTSSARYIVFIQSWMKCMMYSHIYNSNSPLFKIKTEFWSGNKKLSFLLDSERSWQ